MVPAADVGKLAGQAYSQRVVPGNRTLEPKAHRKTTGDNRRVTMDRKEIDIRFTYHPPKGDQATRYEQIRDVAKLLAHRINVMCPDSREKSLAITSLEEAVMWANSAIARRERSFTSAHLPGGQTQGITN